MTLHMNIHYMERKFRCEPCAVAFRTHGTLQKHERSDDHKQKVLMASTFGVPTTANPRPFECRDCNVAFRIHGHLAKHLRSKTHVQKLECLQKLPFGTYAEMERAAINLTEIDTTDCENSLASLRVLASRLFGAAGVAAAGDGAKTAGAMSSVSATTGAVWPSAEATTANAAAAAAASCEDGSDASTPKTAAQMTASTLVAGNTDDETDVLSSTTVKRSADEEEMGAKRIRLSVET